MSWCTHFAVMWDIPSTICTLEFQYGVNLKTQSETGHRHADVIVVVLLVQTEESPVPTRGFAGAISSFCKGEALASDAAMGQMPASSLVYLPVHPMTFTVFLHVYN